MAVLSAPTGFKLEGSFRRLCPDLDVILFFATRQQTLLQRLDRLQSALRPAGGLWIAWPKRSSALAIDLGEHLLRELILPTGWVDNKVCAIDQSWSGLRFVRRLSNR